MENLIGVLNAIVLQKQVDEFYRLFPKPRFWAYGYPQEYVSEWNLQVFDPQL